MTGLQLATAILWGLSLALSLLGMASRERSFGQGCLFAFSFTLGLAGAVTFTLLLITRGTS